MPGQSTIEQASGGATVLDELEQKVAAAEARRSRNPKPEPEAQEAADDAMEPHAEEPRPVRA